MFTDRAEAGRRLAAAVHDELGELDDVIVLALPRGGVPVAAEVARRFGAPMDVVGVRKVGVPGRPELAMGAIAEGGVQVLDDDIVSRLGIDRTSIEAVAARERAELERRLAAYRGDRGFPPVAGRTAIVVDDGLATGSTSRVACRAVRAHDPGRLVLAVPVGSRQGVADLRSEADRVVVVDVPPMFGAVGRFYADFGQTTDDEVLRLLEQVGTPRAEHG